jgi:hypothetical protein
MESISTVGKLVLYFGAQWRGQIMVSFFRGDTSGEISM